VYVQYLHEAEQIEGVSILEKIQLPRFYSLKTIEFVLKEK
jgi:hypothetical protein